MLGNYVICFLAGLTSIISGILSSTVHNIISKFSTKLWAKYLLFILLKFSTKLWAQYLFVFSDHFTIEINYIQILNIFKL